LIERWNGSAWSVSPNNGIADLNGIDAVSPSDVWAGELHAVSARAHRDVWAVGEQEVESQPGPVVLILRWNGRVWRLVPHPLLDVDDSELFGVAALSATDVWMVGQTDSEEQGQRTLIEHWDGSSVTVVPSPSPGAVENVLSAVSAVSASDIWATGSYSDGAVAHPLVEHWNGTTWSVVSAQDPLAPGSLAGLAGVAARPGGDVWAVGSSGPDSLQPRPMIEHNAQVSLTDGGFAPSACGVTAGSTVYWSADAGNDDLHTVTSRTGLFDSGPLGPGSLFGFTFDSAGSFAVIDSETGHRSKIVVR
jgi:plastocyanin